MIHDLARDPPFAKLDLVSCRNVLIYFGEELHHRLVPTFHYCLNRPGFLLLGRSENVTGFEDLFEPVDLEHRILARGRRKADGVPADDSRTAPVPRWRSSPARHSLSRPAAEAQRQADHLLLARFAPPGVLVNERLEVVQFRGRTGEFLEPPPGQPQTNLLKMARGDLLVDLQRAIAQAKERGTAARADGVQVVRGNQTLTISLEVLPLLGDRETSERYFLVTFHDSKGGGSPAVGIRRR